MYRLPRAPPPRGSHRSHCLLSDKNAATRVPCFYSGKLTGDSAPKDFPGGWSHRHPLLAHTQIPDSQERRLVGQASPEEQNPRSYRMRWRGDF